MRIDTNNKSRTIHEMNTMWEWLMTTFGPPSGKNSKWTYGKEPGRFGGTLCDGVFDIEWIDFNEEQDAAIFMLKWT